MKHAFGKSLRLLCSSDFQTVFNDAPLRASHQHFLILARFNSLPHPRLGLVVAKKHLRLAVDRNRIKRLVREAFRLQQQALAGIDVVILSRKGLETLDNQQFHQQLEQQWARLLRKANQSRNNRDATHVEIQSA